MCCRAETKLQMNVVSSSHRLTMWVGSCFVCAVFVLFCFVVWGRSTSLVVFGLAVHSVASSILLWGNFPVEGIFPLELTCVQTPFPKKKKKKKTLSDESIIRGLVCAHMHFVARTQKILTFMSWTGECRQQKHTSTHHPRRRNVTTLMAGLKNGHIRKNLTQKW